MIQKTNSRKSWRKRLLVAALALFTLYLCFGVWGIPAILKGQLEGKGSAALGREVSLEKATFNPLSFETKLYGLQVGPGEGQEQVLARVGKLSANPQLWATLFGPVTVKSVSVEDAELWVEKDAGGRMSFQDVLDLQSAQPAKEQPEESGGLPALIVKELELDDLRLHITDSSLATPFSETITLDEFVGRDLGTVEKSGIEELDTEDAFHWTFEAEIETGSGAEVVIEGGANSIVPWALQLETELKGFDLGSVQAYVDESVVARVGGIFGLELVANLSLGGGEPRIDISGEAELEAFSLVDDSNEYARLERLGIGGLALDLNSMTASVEEIVVQKPEFSAVLLEDGAPLIPEIKASSSTAAPGAETSGDPTTFEVLIASARIREGAVELEDRSVAESFATRIEGVELALTDLRASQKGTAFDASGRLDMSANLLGGRVELASELQSLAGNSRAQVKLASLQLAPLQSYLAEFSNAVLTGGSLDLDLNAESVALAMPKVSGSIGLDNLSVLEAGSGRNLVSMKALRVEGIDLEGDAVQLGLVRLEDPDLTIWQNEEGMNLNRIIKIEQEAEQAIEEVEVETGVAVRIEAFQMIGAGVEFVDTSLLSTYESRVSDFDLTVNSISTDPDQIADFEFKGTVDGSARLRGEGKMNFSDPKIYMDLAATFEGYDLIATSPYMETYLGRELAKGVFLYDLNYEIREGQLNGTNDFKIDQLTLGKKVESEQAVNLPLGFAIKLMKGPNGVVEPPTLKISGDLDDPEVKFWPLVRQAFMNLILNAAASPFKLLAGIAGGREDLDTIAFDIGEIEIGQEGGEKIAALQKIMTERPGLNLEVAFHANPKERAYLENQYVKHLLANPGVQVASGLDLLRTVDQQALESNTRELYQAMQARESEADVVSSAPVEGSGDEEKPEADKGGDGVLKRLAELLGLRKAEPEAEVVNTPAEGGSSLGTEAAEQEAELPSFDEMFEFVVSQREFPAFDDKWLVDLANARIQNFKQALLAEDAIADDRVFASGASEEDGAKRTGVLALKLAE